MQQGLSRWSPDAIHDTVASIVRQPAYSVGVRESLLGRVLRLLLRGLEALYDAASRIPGGRYLAFGSAALLILAIIARAVAAKRLRDSNALVRGARGGRARVDPWAESERLARLGRYTDAAHALYAAVLERLADEDRLRIHPSKTSGDYARELRRRGSDSYAPFRIFGRHFDHLIFGVGTCDAADLSALVTEAQSMRPGARAA